jgi:hypothetical protein
LETDSTPIEDSTLNRARKVGVVCTDKKGLTHPQTPAITAIRPKVAPKTYANNPTDIHHFLVKVSEISENVAVVRFIALTKSAFDDH